MSFKRGKFKAKSLLETIKVCLKEKRKSNQTSSIRKVMNHLREVIMIMIRVLKD